MKKGYKKSYLVINAILCFLLFFLFINLSIIKNTSYLFLILSLLIPTLIIIYRYGYERKKRRFTYELAFYIFSYALLFLLVTYIIGTFTGFTRNVYKLDLTNFVHNIIPYFILIFVSELLRYEIVRKGEGSNLAYILITFILILVDLTLFLNTYDLTTGDGEIKYICSIVLPSIFKNIILIHFTRSGGMVPSLIYRVILDLKLVIVPIFPNFGLYLDCIINTIIPVLIGFLIYLNLFQFKNKEVQSKEIVTSSIYKYIIYFALLSIVLVVNALTSCNFRYSMIAIGSGSMEPYIAKGDAIVYERFKDSGEVKIGNILVFKKENKIIVHRIIDIVEVNDNEKVYYTKGDANSKEDGFPLTEDEILGVVKLRIKYIGIPSVTLGELLK